MQENQGQGTPNFYSFGLRENIAAYIRKCDVCAAETCKKPMKTPRAPLGSLRTGAPGDCLATDHLGPLPVTERGNRYILLLTDHYTKYVEIIAVPNMTAEVCAARILNEYVSRWDVLFQSTATKDEHTKVRFSGRCAEC